MFSIHSPHIVSPCTHQLYHNVLNSQLSLSLPKMSFFHNNFVGTDFGYPLYNEEYLDFGAQHNPYLDSNVPIAGPSRSQGWYLNPPLERYADQYGYQESTLLDASGSQFVDQYAYTGPAYCGFNTGESRCR